MPLKSFSSNCGFAGADAASETGFAGGKFFGRCAIAETAIKARTSDKTPRAAMVVVLKIRMEVEGSSIARDQRVSAAVCETVIPDPAESG
jgi:hypothetical protein